MMRLYLSSMGLGDQPRRLLAVIGEVAAGGPGADPAGPDGGATVGVVLNATDDRPPAEQQLAWQIERDELLALGLRPERLDLRDPAALDRLRTVDALWVRGGNTFVLRAAMAKSGADALISERVVDSSLAYAGYSAGAAVLCPDLGLIAEIDDPAATDGPPIMTGLGVLDRPLIPHVGSIAFEEGRLCTELHRRLLAEGVDHHALRDGDALAAADGPLEFIPRLP